MTAAKYQFLHDYLRDRYADRVVLTFRQIEDLLGFALPPPARTDTAWWTASAGSGAEPRFPEVWTSARRTATPNLLAQNVTFERVP